MLETAPFKARAILAAPLSGANWYKKVLLWPLVLLIGFPLYLLAFFISITPLLVGGGLLFLQSVIYLQEGEWHSFSILDVATQTVSPSFAEKIKVPWLASCAKWRDNLTSGRKKIKEPCQGLSTWQVWLFQPRSWFGLHKILLPVLNLVSIPLLLLIIGVLLRNLFKDLRSRLLATRESPQTPIQPSRRG